MKSGKYDRWIDALVDDLRKNRVLLTILGIISLIFIDYFIQKLQFPTVGIFPTLEPFLLQLHNVIPNLIAALVISLTTYWLLRGSQNIEYERQIHLLASTISDEVKSQYAFVDNLSEFGLTKLYKTLDYSLLCQMISNSEERVWIQHIWTRSPYYNSELQEAYLAASTNNADIRILLLNPNSHFAKQRSYDAYGIGKNITAPNETPDRIKNSRDGFLLLHNRSSIQNLSLKYYESLPSAPLYICDNKALIGFFLHDTISGNALHIEVQLTHQNGNHTEFGNMVEKEFLTVWDLGEDALHPKSDK